MLQHHLHIKKLRIFKTPWFDRFARKENISNQQLLYTASDLEDGIWDADLGGGIFKQRLGRSHEGQSGGFRLIVSFKPQERAFFLYGFPKSSRENITSNEKEDLKKLSHVLLSLPEEKLNQKIEAGAFMEILL